MTTPRHALRVERLFDAPREKVFRAWTERDQLLCWYHFNDDWQIAEIVADVRVGGKYRVTWKAPDGSRWVEYGEYREIDPPKRLVKTCSFDFPDFDEDETLLTIEFHERGQQTLVVLVHEGYRDAAHRDNHREGWPGYLDQLAAHLKTRKATS
jgi:uncharacterized protein YndB with AHSA1/START domain